jgi:hypothetical protein
MATYSTIIATLAVCAALPATITTGWLLLETSWAWRAR